MFLTFGRRTLREFGKISAAQKPLQSLLLQALADLFFQIVVAFHRQL